MRFWKTRFSEVLEKGQTLFSRSGPLPPSPSSLVTGYRSDVTRRCDNRATEQGVLRKVNHLRLKLHEDVGPIRTGPDCGRQSIQGLVRRRRVMTPTGFLFTRNHGAHRFGNALERNFLLVLGRDTPVTIGRYPANRSRQCHGMLLRVATPCAMGILELELLGGLKRKKVDPKEKMYLGRNTD